VQGLRTAAGPLAQFLRALALELFEMLV